VCACTAEKELAAISTNCQTFSASLSPMFARRRPDHVDADLDFDSKTPIGRELKEEWLKCKSAADESVHVQCIVELLHKAMTLAPPLEDVPWQDNVLSIAPLSQPRITSIPPNCLRVDPAICHVIYHVWFDLKIVNYSFLI
jgi:hypothetical protein